MCSAVGLPVRDLRRIRMGPIGLGRLKPGPMARSDPEEVRRAEESLESASRPDKIRYNRDRIGKDSIEPTHFPVCQE